MTISIVHPFSELAEPLVVSGQQSFGETTFPLSYQWRAGPLPLHEALTRITPWRDELLSQSTTHGAILFRGFPLQTAQDFDAFVAALRLENFPYRKSLSNAVRINVTERVFTANEAPSEVPIFFHHELAQTPVFPARILFFCEQPAREGGETAICRSDILYEHLKQDVPAFIDDCEKKGLRYTNVMPDENDLQSGMGRSWKNTLSVETRADAEARLRELNYSWEWLGDGCLRATTPTLPAVREIRPGRKTFFNQLIAAFCGWKDRRNDVTQAIRHGDGSLLNQDAVTRAIQLADELTFDVVWQMGDAVLLDNVIAMHARRPFQGPRKVYASLADMQTQTFSLGGD